jgi:hypothetical protein
VKSVKTTGWMHYEALLDLLPTHTSTWTGFHASMDLNPNTHTSTPTGSSSASDIMMMSLENMLDNVEFSTSADTEIPPVSLDPQTQSSSSVPLQVALPITPIPVMPTPITPLHLPVPSTSTPASLTAFKRKATDNDTSRQESRPPHSSKSGKSAGGSSKSQCLTMLVALEELGGKVSTSINTATTALQEVVSGRLIEPAPVRKQRAIRQVQEEQDLDDHEVLTLIKVFQSDVTAADSYLNITRDGVQKLFLAGYLHTQ